MKLNRNGKAAVIGSLFRTMLALLLIALTVIPSSAAEVIGSVLTTDIRAYINGAEIPAYNVDGKLAVVVSDLNNYGFTTRYDNDARKSVVNRNLSASAFTSVPSKTSGLAVGTPVMSVYASNITVELDGLRVDAFNVNGRMAIFFSDLKRYGKYSYDDRKRVSKIELSDEIPAVQIPEADALRYVIHAAGALEGKDARGVKREYLGSNSLEGLRQCARAGARIVELDFCFTSDGELVCAHDWYKEYFSSVSENGVPLTLAEFSSSRVYGCFTPVTLDKLASFLKEHRELLIITDVKDDNLAGLSKIAAEYPELRNRFIAQIYAENEYEPVRKLGFDRIIYTLYRLGWKEKTDCLSIRRFADKHPLWGITFAAELCEVDGYAASMLEIGVPLYVLTVNEDADKYFDMGISGVYTDYLPGGK